jgi:hypothetical protein
MAYSFKFLTSLLVVATGVAGSVTDTVANSTRVNLVRKEGVEVKSGGEVAEVADEAGWPQKIKMRMKKAMTERAMCVKNFNKSADECKKWNSADFAELDEHVARKDAAKLLFQSMHDQMKDQMKQVEELLDF